MATSRGFFNLFAWWPFAQRRKEPERLPVLARFVRTDVWGTGDLLVRSAICRIGRASDNELCLTNDSVSAHHAELNHLLDGTFAITDLGSTNGTWVNGKRIQNHILRDGDVLELGEVRLHFRLPNP